MRFVFDHDLHIHSQLSLCSADPAQSTDAILEYGVKNSLKTLCLTDHFWDERIPGASSWYKPQDFEHIKQALPLPQREGVRFLFGCETDLDRHMTLGVSRERMEALDFIIIPTTHLHMNGFTCRGDESEAERARLWVERFDAVLKLELPFNKVGIAHLTCPLVCPGSREGYIKTLSLIPEDDMKRLFTRAAELGLGIELNFSAKAAEGENRDILLKPYLIAKSCGCRFYIGSDAHHPDGLSREKDNAEKIIELLELSETDKFII